MKASAIIRICIWSFVTLLLCGLLVCGVVFDTWNIKQWSGNWGGYSYGESSTYSIGDTELDADSIHSLKVDWVSGSIHIAAYDGDTILVTETTPSKRDHALRWRVRDGVLQIRYCKPYRFFGGSRITPKELTVYLPFSSQLGKANLQELSIDNVSADIHLGEISVNELDIDSVSAEMYIQNMEINSMELENVSGAVRLNNCTVNSLEIDTVSGNITVEGAVGMVNMQTVSGFLDIFSARCPSYLSAQSVSGAIRLAIPATTPGFRLQMNALSSSLNARDFAIHATGSGSYLYGDGSAVFDIECVSGKVEIQKIYTEE